MRADSKIDLRRKKMIEKIAASPITTTKELAETLGVSAETIRKDLEYLNNQELIVKVHGGVASAEKYTDEKSYDLRFNQNKEQKQKIAQAACDMIEPGDSIFLESGTTMQEVAHCLLQRPELLKSIFIITMSYRIVEILKNGDFSKLFFLGGWMRPGDLMAYGHYTLSVMKDFHVEKAFIGSAGLNETLTLTDYFDEEIMIRRQAMQCAKERILLIDSSKMFKTAVLSVCSANDFQCLITDRDCPPDMLRLLEQNKICYHLA